MSAKKLACMMACFVLLGAPYAASGQAGDSATRAAAIPLRVTHPPVIDGRDDDDAWRAATAITGFRVFDPTEDAEPAFRTEARIAVNTSRR